MMRKLPRLGDSPGPHRSWLVILAVFLAAVTTACSSGSASSSTSASSAPTQTPAAAATTQAASPAAASGAPRTPAPAQPAALQAQIVEPDARDPQSWTYAPNTILVPVGGTITWTNSGVATHTVTADDGRSFDSGALQRGDTWTFTFTEPGTFAYHCTFHAWMHGTVVVGG